MGIGIKQEKVLCVYSFETDGQRSGQKGPGKKVQDIPYVVSL